MKIVRGKLTPDDLQPAYTRWNDDCACVQATSDGGATWTPAPSFDPRTSAGMMLPPVTGDTAQCDAATGLVDYLHAALDKTLSSINAGVDAFGAASVLLTFLEILTGFGLLVQLLLDFAALLIGIGADAVDAAFNDATYEELKQIFYCHMQPDGTFTDAGFTAAMTEIAVHFDSGSIVNIVMQQWASSIGWVGASNIATLNRVSGDCSGYVCTAWPRQFNFCDDLDSWTITCGTLEADGIASVDSCEGSPSIIYIRRTIDVPDGSAITAVWWWVEGTPSTGDVADLYWGGSLVSSAINPAIRTPFEATGFTLTGSAEMLIIWQRGTTGSDNRIPTVRLYGAGTPPAIGHDESDPPCL